MIVTIFFSDSNSLPITGLIPIIKIYDLEANALVVDEENMDEVNSTDAPGWYEYDFSTIELSLTYIAMIDGGIGLTNLYRYKNVEISPLLPISPVAQFGS